MDDSFLWGGRRLREVGVSELNGVRELRMLGILRDDQEGVVATERKSNEKYSLKWKSQEICVLGFLCKIPKHPSGPMGVAL